WVALFAIALVHVVSSVLPSLYCSFHKALRIRDVLARKENTFKALGQDWLQIKPLPRPVEGVRSTNPAFLLPGLLLHRKPLGHLALLLDRVAHVLRDPSSDLHGIRFRGDVVRLIPNRVAAKDSAGRILKVGTVEAEIGNAVTENGEASRSPQPFFL